MSIESDPSNQSQPQAARRSLQDIVRDRNVYRYLLQLSGIEETDEVDDNLDVTTNAYEAFLAFKREIAKRWGLQNNRPYINRVIDDLYPNKAKKAAEYGSSKNNKHKKAVVKDLNLKESDPLPALSLNRLVGILSAIEKYWYENAKNSNEQVIPKYLGILDKQRAIRKYCELSRDERNNLKLPTDFDTYIKERFITEFSYISNNDRNHIKKENKYVKKDKRWIINENYIEQIIQSVIEKELQPEWLKKIEKIKEIKEKVKTEIKAIELQSGLQAVKYIRPIIRDSDHEIFDKSLIKKWESSLPDGLIEKITLFCIENVKLTDEFPIHFKYIEIEKVRTLPLNDGLLNRDIWQYSEQKNNEEISEFISTLEERYAYRARVHFCLNLDNGYPYLIERCKEFLDKNNRNELHFFEEVSGASSIISLVRKALNRTLLWNLPSLKEYFPVAQEVYVVPEVNLYGNDTLATISSTSKVRLVELKDIKKLINLKEPSINKSESSEFKSSTIDFDSYINGSEIFQGNYICFDMLEAIAVSGFYARLRAIKEIGISSKIYLKQLCDRIITQKYLMKGKKRLRSYPFSLKVMESYLQNTVTKGYCETYNHKLTLKNNESNKPWSNFVYDAYLYVTQAYLEEGLTNVARDYLSQLEVHLKYFNHLTYSSYYLCEAACNFLSDKEEREHAISNCEISLEQASKELRERFLKFFRVGEFSQGNLSPSFSHWARIYSLKARIAIFFPLFIKQSVNDLINPIILLEKSRISAARDGNSYYYAKVTLYQSWCYLMQAYIGKQTEKKEFGLTDCIGWAKRLIDHALLCYSESSETAYRDYLKDVVVYNSNDIEKDPDRMKSFGGVIVPLPPLLHPVFNMTNGEEIQKDQKVINIDSSLTKIFCQSTGKIVDLFGQHSSFYFFAYGMLKLCDDYSNCNEDEILENLKEANKFFVCCWAIAEGGGKIDEISNRIERDFMKSFSDDFDDYNISRIRGLYLHRITEFVDLGKIFTVVCQCIISKIIPESDEDKLDRIFKEILGEENGVLSKVKPDQLKYAYGQEHYNQHLKKHFENIVKYLKECRAKEYMEEYASVQSYRIEVISRVFKLLRGAQL
jgi:hypothetical protein